MFSTLELDSDVEGLSMGGEVLDPGIITPKTLLKTENVEAGISEEPFSTEGIVRGSSSTRLAFPSPSS